GRPDRGRAPQARGEVEILDGAVQHQHGGFEAVAIFDEISGGIFYQTPQLAGSRQILRAPVRNRRAQGRVAARECSGEQLLRIPTVIERLPDGVALNQLDRLYASLSSTPAFHHA